MARILWIDLGTLPRRHELFRAVPDRHRLMRITRADAIAEAVRAFRPHLACIEFDYPDPGRLQAVPETRRLFPRLPVLMLTQFHSEALAVWAFRLGVCDYRVKPVTGEVLARSIACHAGAAAPGKGGATAIRSLPPDLIEPAGHLRMPARAAARTTRALAHIADHYHEPVRRADLARLCHLSASEFSRVFRIECGTTFERYLLEFRIAMARDQLAEPGRSIAEVAYASGFNDPSYFCRAFRRLVGATPGAYQRSARPRD